MWAETGFASFPVSITSGTVSTTAISCGCGPTSICQWCSSFSYHAAPYEPPLLGAHRHDWWNLYQRDLRDEIHLPIAAPAAVRIARRLQPGNLHERRVQKRKRHVQQLRAQ